MMQKKRWDRCVLATVALSILAAIKGINVGAEDTVKTSFSK